MDLLFVYDKIVCVMIDAAIRWTEVINLKDKQKEECLRAITTWVNRHGPMKKLVFDGEGALGPCIQSQQYFERKGINAVPRAKGQQIAIVDRRMALLREQIHKIVDQLKIERHSVRMGNNPQ